jgi:hypothetical protein
MLCACSSTENGVCASCSNQVPTSTALSFRHRGVVFNIVHACLEKEKEYLRQVVIMHVHNEAYVFTICVLNVLLIQYLG